METTTPEIAIYDEFMMNDECLNAFQCQMFPCLKICDMQKDSMNAKLNSGSASWH